MHPSATLIVNTASFSFLPTCPNLTVRHCISGKLLASRKTPSRSDEGQTRSGHHHDHQLLWHTRDSPPATCHEGRLSECRPMIVQYQWKTNTEIGCTVLTST